MEWFETRNNDTGSLRTGSICLNKGDRIQIEGEVKTRTVTHVTGRMGKCHAFTRKQGPFPTGRIVRWRIVERATDTETDAADVKDKSVSKRPRQMQRDTSVAIMPSAVAQSESRITMVWSGFDAAWSAKNEGAIASVFLTSDGNIGLYHPEMVNSVNAPAVLQRHKSSASLHIVAIDQPLIVRNPTGQRPVEKALSHVIGKLKHAICSSNTSNPLFGPNAPIWTFLRSLKGYENNPQSMIGRQSGNYIIEVFPAIANAGLIPPIYRRGGLPKYNPAGTFKKEDWRALCAGIAVLGWELNIPDISAFGLQLADLENPSKSDQDKLDAVISAIIGYWWWLHGTRRGLLIGDLDYGYIVIPAENELRTDIIAAAQIENVPVIL